MHVGPSRVSIGEVLKDWTSEEAVRARDDVRALQDHPGWVVLTRLLDAAIERATYRLVSGATLDQADYARSVGCIEGAQMLAKLTASVELGAEKVTEELRRMDEARLASEEA